MNTETVTKLSATELTAMVIALQARVEALESTPKKSNGSPREMTEDDARRILEGDLKDKKHQGAADALGLSYGQVYSCRLEYTFKPLHKAMRESGFKNNWKK